MPSNPLDHASTASQQGSSISDLLTRFGLVVKLPLTFIQWSYREIAPMTLHSFAAGSGVVPSPVISESWTVLTKGRNIDIPDSMDSSLDSSSWIPTTPADFQLHAVGESQCNSPPDLTRQVVRREIYPTLSGTYSNVWRSIWYHNKRKHDVAVKSLKIPFSTEDEKSKNSQKLMREISCWAQLLHTNVLPLYGIVYDFGHFPSLVTPWVDEGSLNEYIANHHLSLWSMLDIVSSLFGASVHARSIVHGDISGLNILVDHKGRAQLSDFGVMLLLAEIPASAQSSGGVRSAVRWTDPQLFELQTSGTNLCRPTEQTDIYSIGSVILQLLTGSIPYYDIKDNIRVLVLSSKGVKPKCPQEASVTSAQWSFIQRCWSPRGLPSRPTIDEIKEFLECELRMAGLP
ncbi:kinase-like protein [Suillus decipiens]|nr:kinase-like protein [Suillus decipiens]